MMFSHEYPRLVCMKLIGSVYLCRNTEIEASDGGAGITGGAKYILDFGCL